ncbi:MAG: hypothetical protein ACJ75B_18785 [Flavisolibacter sp.]
MNQSKNRKSEAEENFEVADNGGRFSGNDADAQDARKTTGDRVRAASQDESNDPNASENTDKEARRDPAQAHDYKGEAQNVNDDTGRTLNQEESEKARNKANQGNRS